MTLSQLIRRNTRIKSSKDAEDSKSGTKKRSMMTKSKSFLIKLHSKHFSIKKPQEIPPERSTRLVNLVSMPLLTKGLRHNLDVPINTQKHGYVLLDLGGPFIEKSQSTIDLRVNKTQDEAQSLEPSATYKDAIFESNNFEVESISTAPPVVTPTRSSTSETLMTPTHNKRADYTNDTIFGTEAVTFDEDFLSHSTSREEDFECLKDGENANVTEVDSLNDLNFQIFQAYSQSKSNLKLIGEVNRKVPMIPEEVLPLSMLTSVHLVDDISDESCGSIQVQLMNFQQSFVNSSDDLSSEVESRGSMESAETFEEVATGEVVDGILTTIGPQEVTQNDNVYRKEMMALVGEHRLLLKKQQQEIQHLKELLFQERRLNSYLASVTLSGSPSSNGHTTNKGSNSRKFRSKFLPMKIAVSDDNAIKPTKLSNDGMKPYHLLPPLPVPQNATKHNSQSSNLSPKPMRESSIKERQIRESFVRESFSLDSYARESYSCESFTRESLATMLQPKKSILRHSLNSKARASATSSFYYSALDIDVDEIKKIMSSNPPLVDLDQKQEKKQEQQEAEQVTEHQLARKTSSSSSVVSVMSTSHKEGQKSKDAHENECKKEDQSTASEDVCSLSASSYTNHSNSTVPEQLSPKAALRSGEILSSEILA